MRDSLGTPIAADVVGLDQLVAGYERIADFVARNGIRLHPASRIAEYGRTLDSLVRSGGLEQVDGHTASLELRQLVAIVDGLQGLPNFAPELRALNSGHHSSLLAPTHDPGRDKQFELFVAATLANRGLRVELEEPDVGVDLSGIRVGVAAKRPRSAQGIESALRDARDQIRRTRRPGLVAIDATMFPVPDGRVITAWVDTPKDVGRATSSQLTDVVAQSSPLLSRALGAEPSETGTIGILLHMAVPYTIDIESKLQMLIGEAWSLVLPSRDLSGPAGELLKALKRAPPAPLHRNAD